MLGEGEPKYLNSSETDVFSKRRLLYGLNWAKQAIRKNERVLLVEGYFDLIRLVLAGIDEVVAPLGTALTEAQASLLRKYTKNVFLLYDSDAAGQKATFRAGDELLRNGVSVRVVSDAVLPRKSAFGDETGPGDAGTGSRSRLDRHLDRKIQILQRGGWFADLRRSARRSTNLLLDPGDERSHHARPVSDERGGRRLARTAERELAHRRRLTRTRGGGRRRGTARAAWAIR